MKSKVYFSKVSEEDSIDGIQQKLINLLEGSKVLDCIAENDRVCIKIHFGEDGNTGYVKPEYIKIICDQVKLRNASIFISDTNTLYQGRRTNSQDHLKLAYEHGFTPDKLGAEVVIPDDSDPENVVSIDINQNFIKTAKIARAFIEADVIIDIAHFKGHIMTGFGGVLKNIGMGCASREGKLAQHCDVAPVIIQRKCVGCGACEKVCPVRAVSLHHNKAILDDSKCIGCASCIAACAYSAIDVSWESGKDTIQQKMIEYAKAVIDNKKTKIAFLNFAVKITKECDCIAKDDPRIAPDIGIFASIDPVSIDKACMDLINNTCNKDIFKQAHPNRDGNKQLQYACEIGLGNLDYELIGML